jgi:hypothetical protein
MGEITVIKSLALSKLVHLLTALPNLTQSRLNENCEQLFSDFSDIGKNVFLLESRYLTGQPHTCVWFPSVQLCLSHGLLQYYMVTVQ